jgi:hypothetical protein
MTRQRDVGVEMDKKSLKQGMATAEDLGDGLFCIADSKVLEAFPCRQLGSVASSTQPFATTFVGVLPSWEGKRSGLLSAVASLPKLFFRTSALERDQEARREMLENL